FCERFPENGGICIYKWFASFVGECGACEWRGFRAGFALLFGKVIRKTRPAGALPGVMCVPAGGSGQRGGDDLQVLAELLGGEVGQVGGEVPAEGTGALGRLDVLAVRQ